MRWKIEVRGQSRDLEDLETAVAGLHAQAFRDGDRTFLYAGAFEHIGTAEEVFRAAERLVAIVTASLWLSDPAAEPLALGPVVDAQGATHTVMVPGTAALRARPGSVTITVIGEAIRPSEALLAKRTRLIDANPDVAKAVSLLNAPDETLGSLARALEIAKGDLGNGDHEEGGKRAAAISGVSEQDLLVFMDNVNYPSLGGNLSRHAGKNKKRQLKRPSRSMGRAEAEALVRRVLIAWIDAKT